jgi:hypothetical protein
VTTRLTTTERTDDSGTASVDAVTNGAGVTSSAGWSSACPSTSRPGVSTSTVMCRRTSSASKVVSWWTTNASISSPATAASTASATSSG